MRSKWLIQALSAFWGCLSFKYDLIVPAKPYTAAITQSTTSSIKKLSAERGSLKSFQANDPKLTLVAGGYPFVGGNTEAQDIEFAEHVLRVFKEIIA